MKETGSDKQQHFHKGKPGSRRGWRLSHGVTKAKTDPAAEPTGGAKKGSNDTVALPSAVLASMRAGEPWVGYLAPEGFVQPLMEEMQSPYWPTANLSGQPDGADADAVNFAASAAPAGPVAELLPNEARGEAQEGVVVGGRLLLKAGGRRPCAWAQDIWPELRLLEIQSVNDAAAKLRQIHRNWVHFPMAIPSRGDLIAKALPHLSGKPLEFGAPLNFPPLGAFGLLDANTLLVCPRCDSLFPFGELHFQENRDGPPSRAYLKLWELFTRLGVAPQPGQRCVDLGASPGGWTWVLANLGCEVVAVDKADLAPELKRMPGVSLRRESAFGIDPQTVGAVDWLFSDIICYPQRLLTLVRRWQASGLVRNWVCSLKLQGETDHDTIRQFAAIPGSRLMHLSVNRHELTWCLLQSDAAP